MWQRLRFRAGVVLIAAAVLSLTPVPGAAAPGGDASGVECDLAKTICVVASATDGSECGTIPGGWHCTPRLVATAVPDQPLVRTGGKVKVTGTGTCEFRKKSDGLNNQWTPWQSCDGQRTKTCTDTDSWGLNQAPRGAQSVLAWSTIKNFETFFAQDCVEIRVSIRSDADASSQVAGVTVANTDATVRFPNAGNNLDGICEGGGPY